MPEQELNLQNLLLTCKYLLIIYSVNLPADRNKQRDNRNEFTNLSSTVNQNLQADSL